MITRARRLASFMRANGLAVVLGLAAVAGAGLAIRWISASHDAPPPRKAMQFTMVKVQPPPPPPRAPEPPPPTTPPKEIDQPESTRVELRATDIPPPDAPKPSGAPAAGPLALATEGTGPGDAFNLAGNPGGRGFLGGAGDGSGDGVGGGSGNRFGWYYARLASEIEEVFRRHRSISTASVRVEVRVWADASGRISRVQLLRSTGDPALDEAIQSVVGVRLREPPPADIPMPMIARLTARRPG